MSGNRATQATSLATFFVDGAFFRAFMNLESLLESLLEGAQSTSSSSLASLWTSVAVSGTYRCSAGKQECKRWNTDAPDTFTNSTGPFAASARRGWPASMSSLMAPLVTSRLMVSFTSASRLKSDALRFATAAAEIPTHVVQVDV